MRIMNNMSSAAALGELKKNDKAFGKVMKKIASGVKLNSAGDGAAEYAISENMRVRLRCLGQDSENVQKGKSLLQIAEGAVQSQINLMRTIKERVINANNDTNTDMDRQLIQKEINQYYDEINDIAYETQFNGRQLLVGNTVAHTIRSWIVQDKAVLLDGSDTLGIIHDAIHPDLDGQEGMYATFGAADDDVAWDGYNMKTSDVMNLVGSSVNANKYLHGGTPNKPNTIEFDLAGYTKDTLRDVSFDVRTPYATNKFILSTDVSNNYRSGSVINITSCDSTSSLVSTIKAGLSSNSDVNNNYNITVSGTKIILETKSAGEGTNNQRAYNIEGASLAGGDKAGETKGENRTAAPAANVKITGFNGGADAVTKKIWHPDREVFDPATDKTTIIRGYFTYETITPAKSATATVSGIEKTNDGSGITVNIPYQGAVYIMFKEGAEGFSLKSGESGQYYTVGKDYSGSKTIWGTEFKIENGTLKITAPPGSSGNNSSITNGIKGATQTVVPPVPNYYMATTPLPSGIITNRQEGENGETAHWDLDFSAYKTTSMSKANELISQFVGKALTHSNRSGTYEFVDSGSGSTADNVEKIAGSKRIDLAAVRTMVNTGKTVAEAMATVIGKAFPSEFLREDPSDTTSAIIGIKFNASVPGIEGNKQLMGSGEGELRHFDINLKEWAADKSNIPAELDQKGFRFYCATCQSQWVNVLFINGKEGIDTDRPPSGTATQDIKTLMIDVSGLNNYKDLTKKVDEKLTEYLTNEYKHYFHSMADLENGILTIYDSRRFTLLNDSGFRNRQEKGAKIADGIMDNVIKDFRYLYTNRLIIHHTDKASNNIKIDIPQTSMDQIYGYLKVNYEPGYFNVLTKDMREKLLGWPPPGEKGLIDKGIEYLTDAQALIGAQINRMQTADQNIITVEENTTAAESVIRDSDMAKEYCEFSKMSILTQMAQAILGQSNQNTGRAVELLQGV